MNCTNFKLPYSMQNPIIYDNDSHADAYTDEILLALSSAGAINLRGFITTQPENRYVNKETYELDFLGRSEIINKAGRSGFKNLPPHYRGPSAVLKRPETDLIEDTEAIDTPGSRCIIEEAAKASRDCPLVLIMGGPLTAAADAYLLDNSIADRVIVAWGAGFPDNIGSYNGYTDPWASFIVLQKLRMVIFPTLYGEPHIPKERLSELPESEFSQWMIDKQLPHVKLPGNGDVDGQPVIAMLSDRYIKEAMPLSFSHWTKDRRGRDIPAFRKDYNGQSHIAVKTCVDTATDVWWKAMKNLSVCTGNAQWVCPAQRPVFAVPFPIGKISRIEAEDFDNGGEGVAYHIESKANKDSLYRSTDVNIEEVEDIPGGYNVGAGGGYCVTGLNAGDWLEYTLNIERSCVYDLYVRASWLGDGGCLSIGFDGSGIKEYLPLPVAAGTGGWHSVKVEKVPLTEGTQVMKLELLRDTSISSSVKINFFELCPADEGECGK